MTIHSTFGKLAFSLALAGTFLFPGLDARATGTTTDTLNFVNYRDVRDLNPHLYAGEMYAQEMIFETLVDITADGYKPCLKAGIFLPTAKSTPSISARASRSLTGPRAMLLPSRPTSMPSWKTVPAIPGWR